MKLVSATLLLLLLRGFSFAQNNALVLNGAFVAMNGGTSATPVYLVVNQSNALGITRPGGGHIISEADYDLVKWNQGAASGSYVYTFGYSTTDYLPFTFNKTGGNANLAVSTQATGAPNTPLPNTVTNMLPSGPVSDASNMAVDRFWRLQVENGVTAPSGDLTFSYRGSENTIAGISCPSNILTAQYWDVSTSTWITPVLGPGSACATSGVGSAQANSVAVLTTTSSQPFVLVKNVNPLPVELLSFAAGCESQEVLAEWATASEINNNYFTVERSGDALNYSAAGRVKGAGNSSAINHYSFTDAEPLSGTSYYRLKQTDYDGKYKYYGPIAVSCASPGEWQLLLQNVPLAGELLGTLYAPEDGQVQLAIYDLQGRAVAVTQRQVVNGSNPLRVDLSSISSGLYFVSISSPAAAAPTLVKKFVKE